MLPKHYSGLVRDSARTISCVSRMSISAAKQTLSQLRNGLVRVTPVSFEATRNRGSITDAAAKLKRRQLPGSRLSSIRAGDLGDHFVRGEACLRKVSFCVRSGAKGGIIGAYLQGEDASCPDLSKSRTAAFAAAKPCSAALLNHDSALMRSGSQPCPLDSITPRLNCAGA